MKHVLRFIMLAGCLLFTTETAWSQAFPINSDVAIQPAEGQFIYRTQLRYRRFEVDGPDADVDRLMLSNVFIYGWTARLSTVLGVPLVYRKLDTPQEEDEDVGVGDINLLARFQFWKKLGYLASQSWTVLGGLQIPTFDDPFSSRSFDPIVGTVYSWRKNRQGFDGDFVYRFNTENDRDEQESDLLRYDLVYQYRLWPASYTSTTRWTLTGMLELNGFYQGKREVDSRSVDETNSHQLFLSPGLVLVGTRMKIEAGLQYPVYQDVGDLVADDNVRLVLGFTVSF